MFLDKDTHRISLSTILESDTEIQPTRTKIYIDDLRVHTILSNQGIILELDHDLSNDEALIMTMGYKPEFKREFTLLTAFALSFSISGLLPSIAACFHNQQLVIGISPIPWLIGAIFVTSVALSLAEISSAFPVSSGTPYAVSQLAPPRFKALLTWITCWSNWLCQMTGAPAVNYSCTRMILALRSYNDPSKTPTHWQIYLITTGILVSHGILCSLPTRWLAQFNTVSAGVNVLGIVIVFIMILAGNDRININDTVTTKFNSSSTAWSLTNLTDFPAGISMLISFLGVLWSMAGYDSPFHMAEECANAAMATPIAIVLTSSTGGIVGFIFQIAIAYTLVDLQHIITDPEDLGQPFVAYLSQILQRKLVIAATSLTIACTYFMGCSSMLAASRVTFAYSRDGIIPLSRYWKKVNSITQTPVNAVWVDFLIGQVLLLLVFANDTAINAIFSVAGIASFVSFTMPTLLKITYSRINFIPGPWHLGKFSQPIGWVSVCFVAVMVPILCFPTSRGKNLTLDTMNWTVVVYFGPMTLAIFYYFVSARKWYKGPKSNLDKRSISFEKETSLISSQSNIIIT